MGCRFAGIRLTQQRAALPANSANTPFFAGMSPCWQCCEKCSLDGAGRGKTFAARMPRQLHGPSMVRQPRIPGVIQGCPDVRATLDYATLGSENILSFSNLSALELKRAFLLCFASLHPGYRRLLGDQETKSHAEAQRHGERKKTLCRQLLFLRLSVAVSGLDTPSWFSLRVSVSPCENACGCRDPKVHTACHRGGLC